MFITRGYKWEIFPAVTFYFARRVIPYAAFNVYYGKYSHIVRLFCLGKCWQVFHTIHGASGNVVKRGNNC